MSTKKEVIVLGGGTFNHVRSHLSLAAPAFGTTARELIKICKRNYKELQVVSALTRMADHESNLITNEDIEHYVDQKIINNNLAKIVFFNVALCDFEGQVDDVTSGKYAKRLKTSDGPVQMALNPAQKILSKIRQHRKDIFLVGFKTTCRATEDEQFAAGLNLLKSSSCNLVLANDVQTRVNMIITPEEGVYAKGLPRTACLHELVEIAYKRSHLSFTRSTVVDGEPVKWDDAEVPASLREVINWCISKNAYKPFNGVTTGHFAAKIEKGQFLTSIRKTNFNDIRKNGLVRVTTDGDDNVIAYGNKPSVGGQSQRIIFDNFSECDCIVHFHCPLKSHVEDIPVVSQRDYECGSHQCGENTASGLKEVEPGIYAVMLHKHGPNIVFHHSVDPKRVINFISQNFDLSKSTSGFEQVFFNKV